MEFLKGDKFLVESLVIPLDLPTATRVVRPVEDQFDAVFLCFSFEDFRDELFSIIEVNLTRDSSGSERPAKSVDRGGRIFVKIDHTLHPIA